MKISLQSARVNAKLTQQMAAKKIGVSKDTISNWERGKSFPSITHIPSIEKAYGVSYSDIIFLP